jgi:hypothetical protein
MNAVVNFLLENRRRLELERHGLGGRISALVVTPRFRASRHVVVLVLGEGSSQPALVVKIPRVPRDVSGIEREHALLSAVHSGQARAGVPQPVMLADCCGTTILVETAVHGRLLTAALARRDQLRWGVAASNWLALLPRERSDDAWTRLVERPLRRFACDFDGHDRTFVERTLELVAPLNCNDYPVVVEHGDFAQPNILVTDAGLGAIDWELGEERGLPATDLCFFLLYLSLARARATTDERRFAAFDAAFVGRDAWGRAVLDSYARSIDLEPALIQPLVLASLARYVARFAERLAAGGETSPDIVAWIQQNRYYALWRHAVDRLDGVSKFGHESGRKLRRQRTYA